MEDPGGILATKQSATSNLSDLTLSVRLDGATEQEVFLQHGLSVGRNPSNTICVNDPGVERIHAQVIRRPDGEMFLECTSEHLTISLPDGSAVHELTLKPGTTFKIGKAVIRCLRRETKVSVVVADSPWKVSCPVCREIIIDLPHDAKKCPHCRTEIYYLQSHADQPGAFEGWVPRQIGPYKVRAFVAEGGMGIILRGLHQDLDLPAAVKLLKTQTNDDPQWTARFSAEIDTLKSLKHPNVVRLQDHGIEGKLQWLAMDWIDGRALAKVAADLRAKEQLVPIELIKDMLSQVVAGLQYLHDKQIIHRDLKPSNVLTSQDGLVKLVDFGIARAAGGQTAVMTQLTHTGMIAGTESYMSPEQADGRAITPASDIYSLGVMWYELVTGRRPMGSFAAPGLLRPDCPPGWNGIIGQCLSMDPRSRPGLSQILQALTVTTAMPPPLPGQPRPSAPFAPQQPQAPVSQPTAFTTMAPPVWEPPQQPAVSQPQQPVAQYPIAPQQPVAPRPPVQQQPTVPPAPQRPVGPGAGQAVADTAAKVGGAVATVAKSAAKTVADGTRVFLQEHPPKQWLDKTGKLGIWVKANRGPAIGIGAGIGLILLLLIVRSCSSSSHHTTYTPVNGNPTNPPAQPNTPGQPQVQNPVQPVHPVQPVTPTQSPAEQYAEGLQYLNAARTANDANATKGIDLITRSAQAGNVEAMDYLVRLYSAPAFSNPTLANYWYRQGLAARQRQPQQQQDPQQGQMRLRPTPN